MLRCLNFINHIFREKPNDIEWNELAQKKIPLLLNYAQCMLCQKNYYKAIECCTEVLKYDPNNLKAYYRRAKSHVGAWNDQEAQADFEKCLEIDPSLKNAVAKELTILKEKMKQHDDQNKSAFQKMF